MTQATARVCKYLIDDEQSAELETVIHALRGFSEMTGSGGVAEGTIEIDRLHLKAIFDMLESRIDAIRAYGGLPEIWVEEDRWKPGV